MSVPNLPPIASWFPFKNTIALFQNLQNITSIEELTQFKSHLISLQDQFLCSFASTTTINNKVQIPADFETNKKIIIDNNELTLSKDQMTEISILAKIFYANKLDDIIKFVVFSQLSKQEGNQCFWSRGITTVLSYYENFEYEVQTLKLILEKYTETKYLVAENMNSNQSLQEMSLAERSADIFHDLGKRLLNSTSLFLKLINLLNHFQVTSEIEKLDKEKGIGDERHRVEVHTRLNNIRNHVADILYLILKSKDDFSDNERNLLLEFMNCGSAKCPESYILKKLLAGWIEYQKKICRMDNLQGIQNYHQFVKNTQKAAVSNNSNSAAPTGGLLSFSRSISTNLSLEKTSKSSITPILSLAWSIELAKFGNSNAYNISHETQQLIDENEVMIDNSIIDNNVLSILNNIFEISRNSAKSSKMCNEEKFSDVDFINAFDYLLKNLICYQSSKVKEYRKICVQHQNLGMVEQNVNDGLSQKIEEYWVGVLLLNFHVK